MSFNYQLPGTISGNTTIIVPFQFGNGDDLGAIYTMAMPRTVPGTVAVLGQSLRVNKWWKVRRENNTIQYWVSITNPGNTSVHYDLCGGGLQNAFDHAQGAKIPARGTMPWSITRGSYEDYGAQFIMANPVYPSPTGPIGLATYGHSKARQTDGSVYYWFTVQNDSAQEVEFDVSGGGLINGWDHFGGSSIAPTAPGSPHLQFARDIMDVQAQYLMANPVTPGTQLTVDFVEVQNAVDFNTTNRLYTYSVGTSNPMQNPVIGDVSGGGLR